MKIPQLTGLGTKQTANKVGMLGTARRKVLGNSLAKSSADDYILADRRGRLTIELSVVALGAMCVVKDVLGCFTASGCLILLF